MTSPTPLHARASAPYSCRVRTVGNAAAMLCRTVVFLLAALWLAIAFPALFAIPSARAASLTEDHTLFYYLVEMQRHFKKTCNGQPVPEAPSLAPSEPLRKLALDSVNNNRAPETVANEAGLGTTPHYAVTLPGATPQEAFDHLMATACPIAVLPEWKYIGAAKNNTQWVLIMAAAEPGAAQAASQSAGPLQAADSPAQTTQSPVQTAGASSSQPASAQPAASPTASASETPAPTANAQPVAVSEAPVSTTVPAAVPASENFGSAAPLPPDDRVPGPQIYEVGGSPQPVLRAAATRPVPAPRPEQPAAAPMPGDPFPAPSVYGPSVLPRVSPGESPPAAPRPVDYVHTNRKGWHVGPITPLDNGGRARRRAARAQTAPVEPRPVQPAPVAPMAAPGSGSYGSGAEPSIYGPSSLPNRGERERAPAASRPVGEMQTDGSGRPIGPFIPFNGSRPAPVAPSYQRAAPAQAPYMAPQPAPRTDGSLRRNDPNAVAPSRITEEMRIDSQGRPIGR